MTRPPPFSRSKSRWPSSVVRRALVLAALAASGALGCSEAVEPENGSHTEELMANSESLLLPRGLTSSLTDAKFCFDPSIAYISKFRTLVRAVQNAADQWEAATNRHLRIGTIEECGAGVPIRVEDLDGAWGATHGIGRSTTSIRFDPEIIDDYDVASWVAAHELGHALGIEHEHLHEDSNCDREAGGSQPGDIFWSFDEDSIMNYCAFRDRSWTSDALLSSKDKYLSKRIYGGRNLETDRKHFLRSSHGPFLFGRERTVKGVTTVSLGTSFPGSQFVLENYDNAGEPLTMNGRAALKETSSGKYLRIETSRNSKTRVVTYTLTLGSRTVWRLRGYEDTGTRIGTNQALGLSKTITSPGDSQPCQRIKDGECKNELYLTATRQPKSTTINVGLTVDDTKPPPKDARYLWRAMGPM